MSSAQKLGLSIVVLVAPFVGYAVLQSFGQEAETQTRAKDSTQAPSFRYSDQEEEVASDRILVKLKDDAPTRALDDVNRQNNVRTDKRIPRTRGD